MTELRAGWCRARVGEVLSVTYGKALDKSRRNSDGPFLYVGSGGPITRTPDHLTDCETIVVGRKGTAGSVQRYTDGCWPSDTTFYLEVPAGLNGALIEHQLRAAQLGQHDRSTALPGLGRPDLEAAVLVVPPHSEQERIVTAIEEAFSKLDAGEASLRTVRQLLKRMRDAVLAAAVTGRLISQDRADTPAHKLLADLGVVNAIGDGLPEGWTRVRLGDVASVGSGTTPKRGDAQYWEDGTVPWVTSGLITNGIIREAREFVTDRALTETSLRLWSPGTLLVAMYGEGQTRGRCAELGLEATCNQACAAISLREPLGGYKDFVRLFFHANYSANRRLASGGVQPNLNAGLIKDMVFALPPARECQTIVAEVERQFSFIEAAERAVDAGLARSAALRRSVLKAAFEGRLVPQDPSDEPASALLERIRDQRSAAPPPTRRRSRASA